MIWNFCIKRPVFTTVIFLVLAIFGGYGYLQMPVQENPDVEFPVVSVNVALPGAAPEVIESEIIDIIEEEINTIEGIRQLRSEARQDVGSIVVVFDLSRDLELATQDVRDAVDRVRRRLPRDAEAPIVRKLDLDAQPIMWVAIQGDERWDRVQLTRYTEDVLKARLESLPGVGQIIVGGARRYAARVRLDPERLAAHQLTVQDVVNTIQANNISIPTGRVQGATREFRINTRGQFADAGPINDLVITTVNGAPVRIGDVGQAIDDVQNDRQVARFAGEATVGMGIIKQSGANAVAMSSAVRDALEVLGPEFPAGLRYTISSDDTEFVEESIRDLITTIFLATTLVVLVVLIFLRTFKGTLVAAVAIPAALLAGFAVINALGFSINQVTMLALILVVGIVVDDAIVVLERTQRHREEGAEREPAARIGTTEVAFPNIANSLALAAVFLPVAFSGGIIGQFFLEFGITVTATVFASTFVALTLTPMLCALLLDRNPPQSRLFAWSERSFAQLERGYTRLLAAALRRRLLTVAIGAGAFVVGIVALINSPAEFAPSPDRAGFIISFEAPEGATLQETDRFAGRIEAMLADMPEVLHQFVGIGLGAGGPGNPNTGVVFLSLTPRHDRDRHQVEIMQDMRERLARIPDGRAFVFEFGPGGLAGQPIELILQHPDLEVLGAAQDQLMAWMGERRDKFVGVRTNLRFNTPEIQVDLDRDRISEAGLSAMQVADTLRYLMAEGPISQVERDAKRYDVILDIAGRGNLTPEVLRNIYLRNGDGLVPIDNLVTLTEAVGPSTINRYNRMRAATISASTPPGVVLGDATDVLAQYVERELPIGVEYAFSGQAEDFAESFFYLTIAFALSIVFIYLVLAAQFESFALPLTIMAALPLATVGAFGSLWLLGMPISVYVFIGIIMLMGLVTKNSILLIDYTNVLVARGRAPMEAALEAGTTRLRPVLMTAISTILGMMPIAFGFGAGGEVRAPLGVAVAAGLFSSTLLTLVVVPVLYTYLRQFEALWRKRMATPPSGSSRQEAGA
ncbi:MAG: efflux RND transporter permease subunit [Gammaproteobacteria bacterium]|nr:MAG: efflux RND transporter permease subunit [Gammaproteobacteria bacterium]